LSTAQAGARGREGCCTYSLFLMYRLNQPSLKFLSNFVVIYASEASLYFKIFILHNSRCQLLCGSCTKLPRISLQCYYIFLVLPALLSVENWVPLMPVLGGVRDVALIHYSSCTDSIKPSLQFLRNFVVINASDWFLYLNLFDVL
jgi:hypothetical protein